MAFDQNKDINSEDMLLLDAIKYDHDAIRKTANELGGKTDEYSQGFFGVLIQMLGFLERGGRH